MSTVADIQAALASGAPVTDAMVEEWIIDADPGRARAFFGEGDCQQAVADVASGFATRFLNSSNQTEVPIRRKTKFLLVLNSMSLNKIARPGVFNAVKDLDDNFEESMKAEGKMPFDSELGRMSEHALVLMMRCLDYKFSAAEVHEFAEQNTQFAIQLLLAVLLKEPPYEFELRCNCMSALLGFTQPQAFFSATDKDIKFHECNGFTEKVDFTLDLMLRLSAVQVLNDVITAQMYEHATIQPLEAHAVVNTMRCIMNIFQFSSKGSTQWRQHIILSTTFVDGATTLYIQGQAKTLESLLAVNAANVPMDMLRGLSIALKFFGFATFHMGRHGRCMRPLCAFAYNLLNMPIRHLGSNGPALKAVEMLYANFFHFLCNIDALAGDEDIVEEAEDLIPELRSNELRTSITSFLRKEVCGCLGKSELAVFHKSFTTVGISALVSHDTKTFQEIDAIFVALIAEAAAAAPAPAPVAAVPPPVAASSPISLGGDMPTLIKKSADRTAKKKKKKVDSSKAAAVIKDEVFTATKVSAPSNINRFACALNGHTMKIPVTSPYGHNFEKDTIEQWISSKGPVCPLTGKPLDVSDLQPNKALQNEITQEVIRESMAARPTATEDDLYDF